MATSLATTLVLGLGSALIILPGCEREPPADDASARTGGRDNALSASAGVTDGESVEVTPRLPTIRTIGGPGLGPGRFVYPRAMEVDLRGERLYVIDRSGRIQVLTLDGTPVHTWWLPSFDRGYPTGMSVHPESGDVYVADTHEHRVLIFTADGVLKNAFGAYGTEPGQFMYPTDIAFGDDGRIYVSEYGGNDRIQIFASDFTWLASFGSVGPGEGQFVRPQTIVFESERDELWIADSCNHRIVITDAEGVWQRTIGGPGTAAGEFSYPYGLVLEPNGNVLVVEFGNNRLQWLKRDGAPLALRGGHGTGTGQLVGPWTAVRIDDSLFVLDSRNSRVQVMPAL